MKRLLSLIRSRRGETLVEVLVSMVLFLMVMAVLSGVMQFAAGAQSRAEAVRQNAEMLEESLRTGPRKELTDRGSQTFDFRATTKDESQTGSKVMFSVTVGREEFKVSGAAGFPDTIFRVFTWMGGGS